MGGLSGLACQLKKLIGWIFSVKMLKIIKVTKTIFLALVNHKSESLKLICFLIKLRYGVHYSMRFLCLLLK